VKEVESFIIINIVFSFFLIFLMRKCKRGKDILYIKIELHQLNHLGESSLL